ncbi:MAG: GntR family transcriptional regulator [Gammaproteobacteria bacterium]|nr:GntR family transcriptional regulator [Gammaproteobacteria bacterium]
MTPHRNAGKPRYAVLSDELRDGIRAGKWVPGDLLPSESQLCLKFGVSRGTVVKAIDVLLAEGLLQRRQGVGTFVSRPALHRSPGYLLGFSETVRRQGRVPSHRLMGQRRLDRSEALQYGCDEPALLLERIRLVDGFPWAIHTALVPMRIAAAVPALTGPDSRVADSDFSLYRTFDEAGLEIDHADETINVRLATDKEAKQLGIELPSAVMLVYRKSFDQRGNLIELIEAVYLQDCYTYDARLVRSNPLSVLYHEREQNHPRQSS